MQFLFGSVSDFNYKVGTCQCSGRRSKAHASRLRMPRSLIKHQVVMLRSFVSVYVCVRQSNLQYL